MLPDNGYFNIFIALYTNIRRPSSHKPISPVVFCQKLTPLFSGSFSGVVDYISTEISTSKQKKFPLVTFVDTPGLVDGDMNYPFDVNQAILWLGDLVDLIFVFFDPIGQVTYFLDISKFLRVQF